MVTIPFQKPDKVLMLESGDSFGVFEFRPLQQGYGQTIGNALRRVLLSSLEGYAITSIRIEDVPHEFSAIPGVIEDVSEIILRMKQIRLKCKIDNEVDESARFTISGKDKLVAGDFNNFLNKFQVLNKDLHICTMEPNVKLNMGITIEKGRGYISAEENKVSHSEIYTIAIDSIHTPIKNVKYRVENYRVEQKTDFEKLILEITTDSSITPTDALKRAASILIQHFALFSEDKITLTPRGDIESVGEFDEATLHTRQLLKTKLADLDLSVRALNCLKVDEQGGLETLGELVSYTKSDLLKFRNFGKKTLVELEDLVKSKNLEFGMNLAKYGLDLEKE